MLMGCLKLDIIDHQFRTLKVAFKNPNAQKKNRTGYIRYSYSGKELVDDLDINLHDYGARYYDPTIARWTSVDPMAEVAPGWSPFRYGFDNPVRYTDPTGMFEYSNGYSTSDSRNETGSVTHSGVYQNGDAGDHPDILSGLKAKWNNFKNWLFGSSNDQPSNTDVLNAIKDTGEKAEKILDAQIAIVPGISVLDSRTSNAEKAGDAVVEIGASFLPGVKLLKNSKGIVKGVAKSDEAVTFLQGMGDTAKKIVANIPEGFKKIKQKIKGMSIFSNGKTYISPDADGTLEVFGKGQIQLRI